jgi:type IV secretory pathway TrbD component
MDPSATGVRLYPALTRPQLVSGMERQVFIPLVLAAIYLLPPLAFRFNLVTPAIAVLIVFVLFPRLRRLARRDPQLFAALPGHLRHAGFYPVRVHHAHRRPRSRRTL